MNRLSILKPFYFYFGAERFVMTREPWTWYSYLRSFSVSAQSTVIDEAQFPRLCTLILVSLYKVDDVSLYMWNNHTHSRHAMRAETFLSCSIPKCCFV